MVPEVNREWPVSGHRVFIAYSLLQCIYDLISVYIQHGLRTNKVEIGKPSAHAQEEIDLSCN